MEERKRSLLMLVLLLCKISVAIAAEENPVNAISAVAFNVGVILDQRMLVGKVYNSTIEMALEDFYAKPGCRSRLVLHGRDSNSSITAAAVAALDLVKEIKVQAIIGPQTSEQANFIAIMGSEAQIPIISFSAVSSSLSPSKFPYFVRMAQNDISQARSIASVIHAYSWREVVIIHDDSNSGIGLIPYLIDAIQDIDVKVRHRVVLSSTVNKSMIHTTLRKISEMGTRVFIVHLSFSLGKSFFIHAHKARMMADGYAWIITSELTNRLGYMDSTIVNSMQGVLGFKAFVPESNRLNDFKIRWKELFRRKHPEIEVIDVDVYTLWAYDTVWLMAMAAENSLNWTNLIDIPSLDVSSNGEHYLNSILDTEFRGLTGDVRLVDGQLQSSDFQIVNVLGNGGRGIGFWTPRVGLSRTRSSEDMEKNYSANMEDLDGVIWPGGSTEVPKGCVVKQKIRIGVPVKTGFSEFMKVERNPKDNSIIAKGFCIDVFEKVVKLLPYPVSFEYIPFENGCEEEPNYYDQLVYQVYLKNYDAVVGDTAITANRSNYVDFTQPYLGNGVAMIVPKRTDDSTHSLWWFTEPFKWTLWVITFVVFAVNGFLVWLFEHEENDHFQGPWFQQIGTTLFFCFSLFVFAHRERLRSNYSRGVVTVWTLYIFIVVTSYTANLTTMVTVENLRPAVTNIDSLIKGGVRGDFVGYPTGSFLFEHLKNMGLQGEKLKPYSTAEEYKEALSQGSSNGGVSAIVDTTPYIRIFLAKYCHQYTMTREIYETAGFGLGFVFPIGSDMVPDVSRAVLSLSESKEMFDIRKKWFGSIVCTNSLDDSVPYRKPSIYTFRGILYIHLGVLCMVIFVFILLRVHSHRHRSTDIVDFEATMLAALLTRSDLPAPPAQAIEQVEATPAISVIESTELRSEEGIHANGERGNDPLRSNIEGQSEVVATPTSSHCDIEIITEETPAHPSRT